MNRKRVGIFIIAAGVIIPSIFILSRIPQKSSKTDDRMDEPQEEEVKPSSMELTSNTFENNGLIPPKYTCDRENISPPLDISNVPNGAQGLALIVNDPDAPTGDWVHWLIWNIDPKLEKIPEGEVPENSIQGTTDFGKPEYGGPCPPSGTHRYQFKLYALDTDINLGSEAKKKDLETAMQGHILDQALLVGRYKRE
jgi:Raf kinase inhibitor-like YbhB/YbcL family protein